MSMRIALATCVEHRAGSGQLVGRGRDQRLAALTERAGEVRVAVRTTDSQLAGSLRQNLPGLSARLDASGYRTESWHPAAASGEERHTADTNAGTLTQDSNLQSGQHGQQQQSGNGHSRRPEPPEEQHERKEKGKDFAWLMSSLQ